MHEVIEEAEMAAMQSGDDDGLFDSGFMSGGDEWSYTFDIAGEFYYYCQLHPWMEGTVNVE